MLNEIKERSKNNCVVCFAGVGSAFSYRNNESSLIIAKNGITILVDLGSTVPHALHAKDIELNELDYFLISHSHIDHCGGLERLLLMSRYVYKIKPKVIITAPYQTILWEHTLKGGCEYNEEGLLRFSDFIQPVRPRWIKEQPREMYEIDVEGINLILFRTKHIPGGPNSTWEQSFWSTGLVIDSKFLYTCDTKYDIDIFKDIDTSNLKYIFHDAQLFPNNPVGAGVHSSIMELAELDSNLKSKMMLHHYGDNFEQFHPEDDGFLGFAKPWVIYQ